MAGTAGMHHAHNIAAYLSDQPFKVDLSVAFHGHKGTYWGGICFLLFTVCLGYLSFLRAYFCLFGIFFASKRQILGARNKVGAMAGAKKYTKLRE